MPLRIDGGNRKYREKCEDNEQSVLIHFLGPRERKTARAAAGLFSRPPLTIRWVLPRVAFLLILFFVETQRQKRAA